MQDDEEEQPQAPTAGSSGGRGGFGVTREGGCWFHFGMICIFYPSLLQSLSLNPLPSPLRLCPPRRSGGGAAPGPTHHHRLPRRLQRAHWLCSGNHPLPPPAPARLPPAARLTPPPCPSGLGLVRRTAAGRRGWGPGMPAKTHSKNPRLAVASLSDLPGLAGGGVHRLRCGGAKRLVGRRWQRPAAHAPCQASCVELCRGRLALRRARWLPPRGCAGRWRGRRHWRQRGADTRPSRQGGSQHWEHCGIVLPLCDDNKDVKHTAAARESRWSGRRW